MASRRPRNGNATLLPVLALLVSTGALLPVLAGEQESRSSNLPPVAQADSTKPAPNETPAAQADGQLSRNIARYQARIRRLHGVAVHHQYDPAGLFPPEWRAEPLSVQAAQMPSDRVGRILPLVLDFLSQYPHRVLRANLSDIFLLESLALAGKRIPAAHRGSRIYLAPAPDDGTQAVLGSLHREFASILCAGYPFPAKDWEYVNPPDFMYIASPSKLGPPAEYHVTRDEWLVQGFLTNACRLDMASDVRTVAEWLFTRTTELRTLVAAYQRIGDKIALLTAFYADISAVEDLKLRLPRDPRKTARNIEKWIADIRDRTGTSIHAEYDPALTFPREWSSPPLSAQGAPVRPASIPRLLYLTETFLSCYPGDVLGQHLHNIYLLDELVLGGKHAGGVANRNDIFITSPKEEAGFDDLRVLAKLHHEFAHILVEGYPFPAKEWNAANPPEFQYIGSGYEMLGQGGLADQTGNLLSGGFLTRYATGSIREDMSVFTEWLFLRPDYLDRLAREYPRIARKQQLAVAFYRQIHPAFFSR